MVLDKSVFNPIFHIKINECCIFLGEDKISGQIFYSFNLLEKYTQNYNIMCPKMKKNCKNIIFWAHHAFNLSKNIS